MKSRRNFIKLSGLAALGITDKSYAEELDKKPFIHGFNFKFKSGVPDREIASLMRQLAALKGKIPVLKEFFIGKNVAPRTHGFQYGEIAVFDKKEDLMHYERHPEHQKLVRKILPRMEIGNGMDFSLLGHRIRNLVQHATRVISFMHSISNSRTVFQGMKLPG